MDRRLAILVALAIGVTFAGVGSAPAARLDMLTITPPPDMTVTADALCGQADCAQVYFTFTVTGGTPPYNLICTPEGSGGFFHVGIDTVSCLAQDSEADSTPYASFTLTVDPPASGPTGGGSGSGGGTGGAGGGGAPPPAGGGAPPSGSGGAGPDTTAPTLAQHRDITVDAIGPGGAVVRYVVAATDPDNTAGQIAVACSRSSGSLFPLGPGAATKTTTVTCNAADPAENHATPISFKVTVLGVHDQLLALERELRATRSLSSARRASFLTMVVRAERYFAGGSRAGTRRELGALRTRLTGLSARVSRDRTVWLTATSRMIAVVG